MVTNENKAEYVKLW